MPKTRKCAGERFNPRDDPDARPPEAPRRSRRLAGQKPEFRTYANTTPIPPGSPRWRAPPMDGSKPTRWHPSDPLGWSTNPDNLEYHEWEGENSYGRRLTRRFGLTNCKPVLVSQDQIDLVIESNGIFYMICRPVDSIQKIVSDDLDEIKQILNDWGIGALMRDLIGYG